MDDYYDPSADWSLIPAHMHGAVWRYVMRGTPAGHFLTALMSNDFMEAAGRADDTNLNALAGWARFIYNFAPSRSHGSREAVLAWETAGGVLGPVTVESADET